VKFWTLEELKAKIQDDCDLEGEEFIDDDELVGYINEAIDSVEQKIHELNQSYFDKEAPITLISGQSDYDLPADIYGTKIKEVVYDNGSLVYEIERNKQKKGSYTRYRQERTLGTVTGDYRYEFINSTAGSPKIRLCPTPQEAGTHVYCKYVRNANWLEEDDDVLDIPEAANYVMQYVKVRVYEKEGDPRLGKAVEDQKQEWADTISALTEETADGDNEIEPNLSMYHEMN
jgi:hypothetical protein